MEGYENLRSYAVAEAVYDAKVVLCDRFIGKTSRTHDQTAQAARSGVRNISEGSGAPATSKKMEVRLTGQVRPVRPKRRFTPMSHFISASDDLRLHGRPDACFHEALFSRARRFFQL